MIELTVYIHEYLADQGITSSRVLGAIRDVPRERFVPDAQRDHAAGNYPLPIGHGQTISQPYIVAYMTEQLDIRPGDRVLEIGTGSGYQTAILASLTKQVFTVEIIAALSERARLALSGLGITWVSFRVGNGYHGWSENAPYDRIMVTAGATHVPAALTSQLAVSGRMIIPVGPSTSSQDLVLIAKTGAGRLRRTNLLPVRFVPFTHENEAPP